MATAELRKESLADESSEQAAFNLTQYGIAGTDIRGHWRVDRVFTRKVRPVVKDNRIVEHPDSKNDAWSNSVNVTTHDVDLRDFDYAKHPQYPTPSYSPRRRLFRHLPRF